ncbi:MAG: peptide deformylase [Clostridia bacterium]
MAYREVRKDGDEVLRKKAIKVNKFGKWLTRLLDDMDETMDLANGIGLAAPQIGVSKRIVVIKFDDRTYKLINPEIIKKEGQTTEIEGCLSVPGMLGTVKRSKSVVVEALDESNNKIEIKADGMLAVVLQHEIDHLDGILYTDIALDVFDEEDLELNDEEGIEYMNPELNSEKLK